MIIDPKDTTVPELQKILQGAVAPRPIALASTVDRAEKVNLSPFSFFNCFSMNPPVLVFSPSRRVRDNSIKHTLENVLEVPEVVINTVSFEMVEQTSLASTEYARGVNEFEKAGFTPAPSEKVKPPRVLESPVSFECNVQEIIPLGHEGGAGMLVLCEVVLIHCNEGIFNSGGFIHPDKIDLVARMGNNYYCRASGDAIFEITKPLEKKGIGIDQLPEAIRNSIILTGNNLGRLANVEAIPDPADSHSIKSHPDVQHILNNDFCEKEEEEMLHALARRWIEEGNLEDAWKILLLK